MGNAHKSPKSPTVSCEPAVNRTHSEAFPSGALVVDTSTPEVSSDATALARQGCDMAAYDALPVCAARGPGLATSVRLDARKRSSRLSEPVSAANKRSSPFVGAAIDAVTRGDRVADITAVGVGWAALVWDADTLLDAQILGEATADE